jgi:hypothetical protein
MEATATGASIAALVVWARVLNQRQGVGSSPTPREPSLYSQCIAGGAANAFTSALLNPMDVVKTRMQVCGASYLYAVAIV